MHADALRRSRHTSKLFSSVIKASERGIGMSKVAYLLLALFCFAPQFYFGLLGGGLLVPLSWSLGMSMFAVGTGWRAPEKGILTSVLIGACYAAAANVPIYLVGSWLGAQTSASMVFTAIASMLGLLIFGSLTLLRHTWKHEPRTDNVSPFEKFRISSEVKDVFSKLQRLMNNESAQNERLPEPIRSEVRRGADCDEIAGGVGEFGRDPRNPIPVNGPAGELIYLSNVRTADSQQIMFHRLGSLRNVDIYETVSFDGAIWDILFLHQYHPRKSRRPPSGYKTAPSTEHDGVLLGTNDFLASFPHHLPDSIANTSERAFGIRMRPSQVREALGRAVFERPTGHLTKLKVIMDVLSRPPHS
jgi:hypothetical protein